MADEQGIGVDENTADKNRCPVTSPAGGDWVCGRPLHRPAAAEVDREPVCLMHSRDPGKNAEPLLSEFLTAVGSILEAAGQGEARFDHFVFPAISLSDTKIQAVCIFESATFTGGAFFSGTEFLQGAEFSRAEFKQQAYFQKSKFGQGAGFTQAIFRQGAGFNEATFAGGLQFSSIELMGRMDFSDAIFTGPANFSEDIFGEYADFGKASFQDQANFSFAKFTKNAVFREAKFKLQADFSFTEFTRDADFANAEFAKKVDFIAAVFTETAYFAKATFHGTADLRGSRFLVDAAFRGTIFVPEIELSPSAVFALTKFSRPEEIVFDDVDLSRALFRNCDVSEVWFTSSVRWGTRPRGHGGQVFDEAIFLQDKYAEGLQKDGRRDYRAVAQIYQQLKKNYDARLDYWTANEFHFGEMEMQRLAAPPAGGPLEGLRRWWHRNLSFVAWYRWGSDYGNSYLKPMLWLGALLLAFALIFPFAGMQRSGTSYSVSYRSVWRAGSTGRERLRWEAGLVGKSLLMAVDTATFQKSPEFVPVYPWGRVLAIAEALLTSTLFALFLLAMRRQFRR